MTSPTVERKMGKTMGLPDRARMKRYYELLLRRLRPEFEASSAWCFNRGGHGIDEYVVSSPEYVGLGSGAFGYVDGRVYASTFSLRSYVEHVERGRPGITGERVLGRREGMRYDLMMRLMGLSLDRGFVRARYGTEFERTMWPELTALKLFGAVVEDERGWRLTDRGMFLWVCMMSAFYESVNEFRAQMRAQIPHELEDDEAVIPIANIARA
jgi:coproporphyrinogen III oxidase-like Fe-S oxidoreductase